MDWEDISSEKLNWTQPLMQEKKSGLLLRSWLKKPGSGKCQIPVQTFGFDGADWLLEGVQNQKCHWVARWTPGNSDFAVACQCLVSISPIKIEEKDIY